MGVDQQTRPWGLGQMTPLSSIAPEYQKVEFDPATQLTAFFDAAGALVDMQRGTITQSPKNSGSDGQSGPKVNDDSND
ncbi:putative ATP-grasp-modified RiPP [Nonomuraea angiospora]|uniref:putative ATP-grasp-modified RiPP n=1 Tax=Nonomuraea angiospora TaxID=46172 RepID=UPI00344CCD96